MIAMEHHNLTSVERAEVDRLDKLAVDCMTEAEHVAAGPVVKREYLEAAEAALKCRNLYTDRAMTRMVSKR